MGTGENLEALVRRSTKAQESKGLRLNQTGARFVGKVSKNGKAKGRIVGKGELDFTGHFKGQYVTFDAKSTTNKTSFPLSLLKKHQVTILKNRHEEGALSFFLLEFSALPIGPRYFAMTWPTLEPYWKPFLFGGVEGSRASITREVIETECLPIILDGTILDLKTVVQDLLQRQAAKRPAGRIPEATSEANRD